MAEISINGVRRTEFGKGASRRNRRDGLVPAVIYGHGEAPAHVTLPARELGVALKTSNVLLDIVIDGTTVLTLPKAVVRNALKGNLEHVHHSIEVETEATSIPSFFELDLTGMAAGTSLYAEAVALPAGVTLISDPKMVVVHLSERSTAVEPVAEAAPAAAAPATEEKKES